MEKDFHRCLVSPHRICCISAAKFRLSAAPLCKGETEGLSRGHVGFQQWSVTGSKVRKEDGVRSIVDDCSICRSGEPAIHSRCSRRGSVVRTFIGGKADLQRSQGVGHASSREVYVVTSKVTRGIRHTHTSIDETGA